MTGKKSTDNQRLPPLIAHLIESTRRLQANRRPMESWLTTLDDFRNWLRLGLPAREWT